MIFDTHFLSLSSASITLWPSIAFAIAKGAEATIVMVMMVEKDGYKGTKF
jgi:hypothetical protein